MERDEKELEGKQYIKTPSRAEIFVQAKRNKKGLEIYRRILDRDPSDLEITQKAEELKRNLN